MVGFEIDLYLGHHSDGIDIFSIYSGITPKRGKCLKKLMEIFLQQVPDMLHSSFVCSDGLT